MKEMKINLFIGVFASLLLFACNPAVAEEVTDHYKTINKRVPYTEQICNWVDVPIYGETNGDKTGDTLKGAIIGGIIGNNVTKNVENGGAVGALLGGIIGHNNSKSEGIIGYRQERQCKDYTRYNEQSEQVYSHSTISFYSDGKNYVLRFKK
tara:strand:+ start:1894 stop:2349 length:456 start_codon:yes stop_codon:yes gene_type:complete